MTRKAGASSAPALRLLGWLKARRLRIPLVCFGPARFIVHCLQAASFGADWSRADRWCNADARARKAVVADVEGGQPFAGRDRGRHFSLRSYRRAIAEHLQHPLKCLVMSALQRSGIPGGVLCRMRRIEVSAWHEGESNIEVPPMENFVKIEKA